MVYIPLKLLEDSRQRIVFVLGQEDFDSFKKVVNDGINYHKRLHRHSTLGNKLLIKYLKEKGKLSSRDAKE
jgi:hypothetical protein